MTAWDGNWERQEPITSLHQRVCQATYFLGVAVRHTVCFVSSPYRTIADRLKGRKFRVRRRGPKARRKRITSKFFDMQRRLQSIETTLSNSGRRSQIPARKFFSRQSLDGRGGSSSKRPAGLMEALIDPDPGVRKFALGSIGPDAEEDVNLLIIDALNDPDPDVRCAAVAATAKVNLTSAVFSLILLLSDPMPEVVEETKIAIKKITGKKVKISPRSSPAARQKSIEELKSWWKEERFANLSRDVKTAMR